MFRQPNNTAPSSGCLASLRHLNPWLLTICVFASGCNLVPDLKHKPQYHNPFPQISTVAVMPFRNQSQEPTLSGARVSMAYYNELQSIPGFEVIPFGVVENQLAIFEQTILNRPIASSDDFQKFAKHLGVDAVLQGSVTDYDSYYPPRMTIKVNWYAANPGFHPIPVGYGLPWGTKKEKKIPEWVRLESERALAAEQLKTQLPVNVPESPPTQTDMSNGNAGSESIESSESTNASVAAARIQLPLQKVEAIGSGVLLASDLQEQPEQTSDKSSAIAVGELQATSKPQQWPDPQGFIPKQPSVTPAQLRVQYEPIISHMRAYNGSDEDFTHALGEYFSFRDDARFGGWQAYLQRSEDFIRFCCHQHLVETLASRGGELESRMILRWPIGRYDR